MAMCCICFASLKSGQICATECGHVFHYTCLCTWYQTNRSHPTCPSCRKIINWTFIRRLHLDFGEDTTQNNSIVEDLHQNAISMGAKLKEIEIKLASSEKKYNTLLKTKEVYQERAAKLKQENTELKSTNKDLNKQLTQERKQRKFYENECLALTAQVDELENNW